MDKFVLKVASKPDEKKRSHLAVNITAKERARKYPTGKLTAARFSKDSTNSVS